MSTYSISLIDETNAASRGYNPDEQPRYAEGTWVIEEDGEWIADLSYAGGDPYATNAQHEAGDWLATNRHVTVVDWRPNSVNSPGRDFDAVVEPFKDGSRPDKPPTKPTGGIRPS
jgi:hypothetical protein